MLIKILFTYSHNLTDLFETVRQLKVTVYLPFSLAIEGSSSSFCGAGGNLLNVLKPT
jgi:hypothetical protein